MKNYQKTWNVFWKEICTNPDGSLNLDQIQRELHDYHEQMGEVTKVYDTLTGGRISKPNTMASAVIGEVEALQSEEFEEWKAEYLAEDEPSQP